MDQGKAALRCHFADHKVSQRMAWGRLGKDRQGTPHHSSPSVWESQDHAQGHSNPSIPSSEVTAALAMSLEGRMLNPAPQRNEQGTTALPGLLGCHLQAQSRIPALSGELCPKLG